MILTLLNVCFSVPCLSNIMWLPDCYDTHLKSCVYCVAGAGDCLDLDHCIQERNMYSRRSLRLRGPDGSVKK